MSITLAVGQRWSEIRTTSNSTGAKPRSINRFREILAIEGDRVTFRISTVKDGGRTITKESFRAWIRRYNCTLIPGYGT